MCLLPHHVNSNVVIIARFPCARPWVSSSRAWRSFGRPVRSAGCRHGRCSASSVPWIVATAVVTLRHSPDLLAERLGPSKGAKRWDTIIMGIYGVMPLAVLVVAGLDHRFGWSTGIGVVAQIGAFVVCCFGYALVVWATAANAYFSQIVRIQTERGHEVAPVARTVSYVIRPTRAQS